MRTLGAAAVVVLALLGPACAPKASQADCRAACEKEAALEKQAAPAGAGLAAADPVAELDAGFRDKLDVALRAKAEALAALDAELASRLTAISKEEEQAALRQEHAARRSAREQELQAAIDTLGNQRDEAVEAARQARDKAAADARSAAERALDTCAAGCVRDGVPRSVAECAQNAMSLEELEACRPRP